MSRILLATIGSLGDLHPLIAIGRELQRLGPGVTRVGIQAVKLVTRKWSEPVRDLRAKLGLPPGRDPIYEGK